MRPTLYLDVDGVLNVARPPYREYLVEVATADLPDSPRVHRPSADVVTYRVRVPSVYPVWLAELAELYDLAWATTWEHLANVHIAPLLGLAGLPVVAFSTLSPPRFSEATGDWKWRVLCKHGRPPFVWVDDEVSPDVARTARLTRRARRAALWAPEGLERDHVDRLLTHASALDALAP